MKRLVLLIVLAASLAHAQVPLVFAFRGTALSSEPAWPTVSDYAAVVSTDPADTGFVEIHGLTQNRTYVWQGVNLNGTTPVFTELKLLRINQLLPMDPPAGDVSVSIGGDVQATCLAGDLAARIPHYSVGPGMSTVVLKATSGNVTRIMHRRGNAPQSAAEVGIDGAMPGSGDFWIEGTGECSVRLEIAR